jgi:uncharacterized membrane protein YozB (DUF420 family)
VLIPASNAAPVQSRYNLLLLVINAKLELTTKGRLVANVSIVRLGNTSLRKVAMYASTVLLAPYLLLWVLSPALCARKGRTLVVPVLLVRPV